MRKAASLAFSKLQALGNDFVLIDARKAKPAVSEDDVRLLADRRLGVGCDQLLILAPSTSANAICRVRIYNADGSSAEQCGNGMRAVALWLSRRGELQVSGLLETETAEVPLRIEASGLITAGLGRPDFQPSAWGSSSSAEQWDEIIHGQSYLARGVSMGNPHLVLALDQAPEHEELLRIGHHFQHHPRLPKGANINLAWRSTPDCVYLRVFERGAGPTPACGSGACATAAVLHRAGLIDQPVRVVQPGGELVIHWPDMDGQIAMTGPAHHVFDGIFYFDDSD